MRRWTAKVTRHGTLFLLSLLAVTTAALAQGISTAQINGTVRDEGNLALPGVTVTAAQTQTGLTRFAVTDEAGSYALTNLPVGPYRLEAMLPSFRTFAQTGIVLQVNANVTVNLTLEIGSIEETVTVEASARLVETRNPGVGQIIQNDEVVELPLNGRELTQLVLTAGLATGEPGTNEVAGAGVVNSGVRSYPASAIVVAGGLTNGMSYILDGGTHTNPFSGVNLPLPFPDAMQEFKVETSALPAQYGHHSSAAINAITKSGTNTTQGNLFAFVRNHRLNATNAFAAPGPDGEPEDDGLRRNQVGGTLGGPLMQNKLFYFGGYQGTFVDVAPATSFSFVPTAAMLAGDFTRIASPACNNGRDIELRAPFVNKTINPALLSPAAVNVARRLPATSDPCGRVDYSQHANTREHMTIGRVDYQMSGNASLFGRYQGADLHEDSDFDPNNILAYSQAAVNAQVHSVVIGQTQVFGQGAVSATRVTYNDSFIQKGPYDPFFDAQEVGVKNITVLQPGFMRVNVPGAFAFGAANANDTKNPTKTFQVAEDITVIRGAHQLGFGANYIYTTLYALGNVNTPGNFNFNGRATGLGLADFLLGQSNSFFQGMPWEFEEASHYIGLYLQDSWNAARGFTVNAGLRWEPWLPFTSSNEAFNHFSFEQWDAGVQSDVFVNAPRGLIFQGDPGYPGNALGEKQLWEFAPRLAVAWDPSDNGTTAVRVAWGRFFDRPHMFFPFTFAQSCPLGCRFTFSNVSLDDPYANVPGGNPFPLVKNPDMAFNSFGSYITFPLDLKPSYSDQFNVSFQRQLGQRWAVSASYIDQRGYRLPLGDNINPAVHTPGATLANLDQRRVLYRDDPADGQFYGEVLQLRTDGTSAYKGLLLTLRRQNTNGLTLSTNYTLSRCISDVVNYAPGQAGIELVKPGDPAYDRGSCGGSDRRHVGNLSAVYRIPNTGDGAMSWLTNDWQVSGIVRLQSGNHFAATTGVDSALNGQADQRPNVVGEVYEKDGYQWLNPAAFEAPGPGEYGDHENNSLVGPGRFNVDLSIVRSIGIGGNRRLQFRAEAFNLLNRVNLNNPVSAMNDPNFGVITGAGDSRIMQLAVKVTF